MSEICRPEIRGSGSSVKSLNPGAAACPVCWKNDCHPVMGWWEFKSALYRCEKCGHVSIREFPAGFLLNARNADLYTYSGRGRDYYEQLAKIVKGVLEDKVKDGIAPKVMIPVIRGRDFVKLIEGNDSSRRPNRGNRNVRRNIRARRESPTSGINYFSLLDNTMSPEEKDIIPSQLANVTYIGLHAYSRVYSIVHRSHIMAEGITRAAEEHGKFDVIILQDLLAQVLNPDPLIDATITSCRYFIAIVPCLDSKDLNRLSSSINYLAGRSKKMYGEAKYPLYPDQFATETCRHQVQMYDESSLKGLMKLRYEQFNNGELPIGNLRSLKVNRLGDKSKNLVIHNIPERFFDL